MKVIFKKRSESEAGGPMKIIVEVPKDQMQQAFQLVNGDELEVKPYEAKFPGMTMSMLDKAIELQKLSSELTEYLKKEPTPVLELSCDKGEEKKEVCGTCQAWGRFTPSGVSLPQGYCPDADADRFIYEKHDCWRSRNEENQEESQGDGKTQEAPVRKGVDEEGRDEQGVLIEGSSKSGVDSPETEA